MNEIGSKDTTNKENVVGSGVDSLTDGPLEWMQLALVHLTSRDMGPVWHTCVDMWVVLEAKLEYGLRGKVRCSRISMFVCLTSVGRVHCLQ
jgi:hypothetical protein